MIYCANPSCQVANPQTQETCQVCRWPLVRRYLWAIGPGAGDLAADTVLADRYQVVQGPLLLDLKPAQPPANAAAVPAAALPYLHLSVFPRAIPRPVTVVTHPHTGESLLLLDEAPIRVWPQTPLRPPELMPSLKAAWSSASALQQIGWLWQIATLWAPLQEEDVAASLLYADLVRVDGEDVRLLALQQGDARPDLADLGQRWQALAETAVPSVRPYLTALVHGLQAGQFSAETLTQSLTQALEQLTVNLSRSVQLVTYTDRGPTRQRNEDACYPASGQPQTTTIRAAELKHAAAPFLVVCDGIGGHQGGDVASQLAIEVITRQLKPLTQKPRLSHAELTSALEQAIYAANQELVAQNDQAQRQARDRMGTTLVAMLVYGARLYLAHLGDSRAYRIRPHGLRQITLDDDVAVREARMGYSLYAEALQHPGSGSLVQALGMADSQHLYPTVQALPLATESLFLVCSDGLSDYDLVDRSWTTELLPALTGQRSLPETGQRLIDLANTHNGHDNVTVGLLRVEAPAPETLPTLSADLAKPRQATAIAAPTHAVTSPPSTATPWRWRPLLLSGAFVVALAGVLGAVFWESLRPQLTPLLPSESASTPSSGEALSPTATPPNPSGDRPLTELAVGDFLQIQTGPEDGQSALVLLLELPQIPLPGATEVPERQLPVGSIVQVVSQQKTADNQRWVHLRVCSLPASGAAPGDAPATSAPGSAPETANPASEAGGDRPLPFIQPGEQGWVLTGTLRPIARSLVDITPRQRGLCTD